MTSRAEGRVLARNAARLALRLPVRLVGRPFAAMLVYALQLTRRRGGVALVYHSVAPSQGDPRREVVAPHGAALFEAQMRHLRAHYRIVAAHDLLDAVRSRRRGERFPAAVTFDDDLACHARITLPILRRTGVRATFFLCGASLERPFRFWWERLQDVHDRSPEEAARLVDGGPVRPVLELAWCVEELPAQERDAVAARLADALGPDPADAGMRLADVRELAEGGMDIGFHTRRHDALPPLDDERLAAALAEGRAELEAAAGRRLATVGYPHGRADSRVGAAAQRAGFATGMSVGGRGVEPGDDPLLVPRVFPLYRSAGHFALQLVLMLVRTRS